MTKAPQGPFLWIEYILIVYTLIVYTFAYYFIVGGLFAPKHLSGSSGHSFFNKLRAIPRGTYVCTNRTQQL